ncbi:hypothetical protein BIV24_29065 [Streptomyces colonosanans]|uniref:Uncharacterized protein n=1 Tax=Streptomyces colonosanans TaxID=1428652 RepID=A0A1S2NUR7_9ACTN|nr:hypothetical protein BIV24_29065 [Streptomyces colonosanans]
MFSEKISTRVRVRVLPQFEAVLGSAITIDVHGADSLPYPSSRPGDALIRHDAQLHRSRN